jgi:hypothetical protein
MNEGTLGHGSPSLRRWIDRFIVAEMRRRDRWDFPYAARGLAIASPSCDQLATLL